MSENWHRKLACTQPCHPGTANRLKLSIRQPPPSFEFVTQTLNPKHCKDTLAKQQFQRTISEMISILEYTAEDYCLISELTETGNVHYHAWVVYTQSGKKQYCEAMKANGRFGFYYFSKKNYNKSTKEQQEDTYNYMCKALEETYKFIRQRFVFNKLYFEKNISIENIYNDGEVNRQIQEIDKIEHDEVVKTSSEEKLFDFGAGW